MKSIRSFLRITSVSRIAVFGTALATAGFIAEIILLIGEVMLFESHPYIGIVSYVLIPGMIVLSLLLIPIGLFLRARRAGVGFSLAAMEQLAQAREISMGSAGQLVVTLSLLNLVIFGVVGYRGFHYTESTAFCGELCHEVMQPEYDVYTRSPHSQIACVECHIGPGATSFVKSKLSGVRQLVGVLTDDFSRPIETPVHNLRPGREICETCHRAEAHHGNRLKVVEHFDTDESNTRTYTVLNLHLGGGDENGREAEGIHWHTSRKHEVHYVATDVKRENVVWVERVDDDGTRKVWTNPDAPFTPSPETHTRLMDCVDCHNRPTHVFLSPEDALDEWMTTDRIDAGIPWIRAVAHEIITQTYESSDAAMEAIAALPDRYRAAHPEHWPEQEARVRATVAPLQDLHRTFVYPGMNLQWNTYPSRIGHATPHTQACFRCHNGVLRDEAGMPITLDCTSCHEVLANREVQPRILERLMR